MPRDLRDDAIAELAASEATRIEDAVDLVIERDAYRLALVQALRLLHERHVELARAETRYDRLLAEFRDARAELRRYVAAQVTERAA